MLIMLVVDGENGRIEIVNVRDLSNYLLQNLFMSIYIYKKKLTNEIYGFVDTLVTCDDNNGVQSNDLKELDNILKQESDEEIMSRPCINNTKKTVIREIVGDGLV
ncbi:unnamed protein product [Rhizophagus irregularis]|nr:unnamed protein product [Rhizophagus irregularis]